jgi:uncharacterized protein (DUF433 family)
MSMLISHPLGEKGRRLLGLLVDEIARGRFKAGQPQTFLSYGEALDRLEIPRRGRAGQQLQREGLDELNEGTKQSPALPKIAGLIIDKKKKRPAPGYAKSHGRGAIDWRDWWLGETEKAICFDWQRYLKGGETDSGSPTPRVKESKPRASSATSPSYEGIIVFDPPPAHIRQSRITVGDVLRWLAAGRSEAEILRKHPDLRMADIRASLAYAADREARAAALSSGSRLNEIASQWKGNWTLPKSDPDDPRKDYLLRKYWRNRA